MLSKKEANQMIWVFDAFADLFEKIRPIKKKEDKNKMAEKKFQQLRYQKKFQQHQQICLYHRYLWHSNNNQRQ